MIRALHDGTPVSLRPLRPSDRKRLGEEYLQLSAEGRYARFLATAPALTPRMLHRLVDHVDGVNHIALLLVADGGTEIAVGRFVRADREADQAEVAFAVKEAWQGKGAGSALCDGLVSVAMGLGVKYFTATMLATNIASYHLLLRAGDLLHRELVYGGTLELEVTLRQPPLPAPAFLSDDHL